jgi:hypothetical protein
MHRALVIKYGSEKCIPWQGEFDKATLTIPSLTASQSYLALDLVGTLTAPTPTMS